MSVNGTYDKNLELIKRYREGDSTAGEELITLNAPLVYKMASRFGERYSDIGELVECGNLGLVKAIKTFDFSRECAFSTYAVPLIFGEIRRFLRDDGIIKVSREEKKLSQALMAERERRQSLGEDASVSALAAAVGVSAQDAASALFSRVPVRSLDEEAYGEDDSATVGSTVCDEEEEERSFNRLALRMAIEKLPKMQRKLIILRYVRDISQTKVADMLGLSQVKVSREEKKIMEFLKKELV